MVYMSLVSCLNHLIGVSSTSLCSDIRNHFILDSLHSNALIVLVQFFQIVWIIGFVRPNSQPMSTFFFCFLIDLFHFNFFFSAQNLPFI